MFGHKCVSAAPCLVKTKRSIWAQTPNTNCQARWEKGDDLGLFCSHRTWTPCSHWVIHELLWIPKYYKCETICVTTKARQQDNDLKQISKSANIMAEKENNEGVAIDRSRPDLNQTKMPWPLWKLCSEECCKPQWTAAKESRKSVTKILHNIVRILKYHLEKCFFKLFPLKMVLQAVESWLVVSFSHGKQIMAV